MAIGYNLQSKAIDIQEEKQVLWELGSGLCANQGKTLKKFYEKEFRFGPGIV